MAACDSPNQPTGRNERCTKESCKEGDCEAVVIREGLIELLARGRGDGEPSATSGWHFQTLTVLISNLLVDTECSSRNLLFGIFPRDCLLGIV